MELIESTALWKTTFGESYKDSSTDRFASRLKASFERFHYQANEFARELGRDLQTLTIHDEKHTDALWEVFDVVFPAQMICNPLEAYVLGGAFLIHDLGHALCMYPKGIEQLKETEAWTRATQIARRRGDVEEKNILEQAIRLNHAHFAKDLVTTAYPDGVRLIEDNEIRLYLGGIIGTVAYSHWWDTRDIQTDSRLGPIGAIPISNCPNSWTIDPRKLAVILRVCDACQIDARRAPIIARTLRKPEGVAANHWGAQRLLAKPFCQSGELSFTSVAPFAESARDDWWTAYDLVQIAAGEISEADLFFSDSPVRPKATRVSGSRSPEEFARFVKVDGWEPIDARPTISAASDVIQRLGGVQLYGNNYLVPLRELIQNSRDAVIAKRVTEARPPSWGRVCVAVETGGNTVITVSDNGAGMSERTLTRHLLDFGSSYWNSTDCLEEYPSLNFEEFSPVGKFGIGFFSVFMLGSEVKVLSRSAKAGGAITFVLEFQNGFATRPVFRRARPDEQLYESGTSISVTLSDQKILERILTPPRERLEPLMSQAKFRNTWTLSDAIAWGCPASDVDIAVLQGGSEELAVRANDWISMAPDRLFRRLFLHRDDFDEVIKTDRSKYHIDTLDVMQSPDGKVWGRASLIDNLSQMSDSNGLYGITTCGPFRSSMELLTPGILLGRPQSASRLTAKPIAFQDHLIVSKWATEQGRRFKDNGFFQHLDHRSGHAAYVRSLCGDISHLDVYLYRGETMSLSKIVESGLPRDVVYLYPLDIAIRANGHIGDFDFEDRSHIGVSMGRMTNGKLLKMDDPLGRACHPRWKQYWYSLWGAAIEAVSNAWGCDLKKLLDNSDNVNPSEKLSLDPAVLRRPS